jgi:hypothetical protein
MMRAPGVRIAFLPAARTSWYHMDNPRCSSWVDWFATAEGDRLSCPTFAGAVGALLLSVSCVRIARAGTTPALVFRGFERTNQS